MFKKVSAIISVAAAVCLALFGCVRHEVVALEIQEDLWRQQYYTGDSFAEGTPFTAVYSDGVEHKGVVKGDMVEGFDTATPGEKTLFIEFDGFILEKVINVVDLTAETFPETDIPESENGQLTYDFIETTLNRIYSALDRPENLDVGQTLGPWLYEVFNAASLSDSNVADIRSILLFGNSGFSEMLKQAAAEFDFRTVGSGNIDSAVLALLRHADGAALFSLYSAVNFIVSTWDADDVRQFSEYVLNKSVRAATDPSGSSDTSDAAGSAGDLWSGNKFVNYIAAALDKMLESAWRTPCDREDITAALTLVKDIAVEYLESGEKSFINILQLVMGSDKKVELGGGSYSSAEFFKSAAFIGRIGGGLLTPLISDKFFTFAFGQVMATAAEAGASDGTVTPEKYAADRVNLLYVIDFACDVLAAAENGIPCDDLSVVVQWLLLPTLPGDESRFEAACAELRAFLKPLYSAMPEVQKKAVDEFAAGESGFAEKLPDKALQLLQKILNKSQ